MSVEKYAGRSHRGAKFARRGEVQLLSSILGPVIREADRVGAGSTASDRLAVREQPNQLVCLHVTQPAEPMREVFLDATLAGSAARNPRRPARGAQHGLALAALCPRSVPPAHGCRNARRTHQAAHAPATRWLFDPRPGRPGTPVCDAETACHISGEVIPR